MRAWLKGRREAFLDRHFAADDWFARNFSGATLALWRAAGAVTKDACQAGKIVLDAGSGRGAWQPFVERNGATYRSIEWAPRGAHQPTWTGDICAMPQVPSQEFDVVVCHQVLEHVRHPSRAMHEFRRVLKPDGRLVMSVPHLSRRHELPFDFQRFTPEGVAVLAEESGFAVEQLACFGGLACFLHHQTSLLLPGSLAGIPLLAELGIVLNAPLSWACLAFDACVDRKALFALSVLLVARNTNTRDQQGE